MITLANPIGRAATLNKRAKMQAAKVGVQIHLRLFHKPQARTKPANPHRTCPF